MEKIILIILVAVSITSQAQPVYVDRIGFKLESIADIDIGWMKIYKHTTPAKGKTLGNRIYSDKQIGYTQQFVEWMQQSYLPKGCLGDAGYYQNYIYKFSSTNSLLGNAINEHSAALPHLYGAYSKMYMFLKKDAQGKFVPQASYSEYWRIEANQLQYISLPVSFISSAEEYYFVLPDFTNNPKGYEADDKAASNLIGFANHKNIEGYKHFYIPPKTIDDNPYYVVIMTKDNKELPFEKITIGEFFTQAEKQLPVWQKVNPTSPENFARARKNLVRLKEKYKNKWNDIAELKLSGTDIGLYDFVNATEDHNDMFDNKDIYGRVGLNTTFPILKVRKTALDLCKTDHPQWLVVRWTMGMANQAYNLHLHESVMNNFNFKYAYDYFFDPEKVKGQPYKPLRSPIYKETIVASEGSEAAKKNSTDKNFHFFEDFSTSTIGKKPIGWQSTLALGTTTLITKLDGLDGNWAIMANYKIKPTQLKTPLPQNFTLSYEIVAAQNFTWGATGLTFQLSRELSAGNAESYLQLKLRPGFDGRDGEAALETKFPSPPGYSNGTKWFVAPGFSNNKKNNRITVTIKKKDETLQVFIDKTKIAEYEKAIPAAHLFNAMSFTSYNSGENDKFYISNIKITKD
jgi:hypothetical protein